MLWSARRTSPKRLPFFIKRQLFIAVMFTWMFVASGLIISLLCVLAMVIWPFSKDLYRKLATRLGYLYLGQMIWVCIDWADVQVTLFGEDEVFEKIGKESSLITCSHLGDFDWLIGYVMADGYHFLERIRSLPKKSVFYVPGLGQMLWALEYPFLSRSWSKDEASIRKSLRSYKDYPFPLQVVIFCEGTRFSQDKFLQGVEYSKTAGLTPLKYHLVPRTKGYAILAQSLKHEAHFPATYDIGFAYPKGQSFLNGKRMTLRDVLAGQKLQIYMYVRRIPFTDVPDTREELQQFCHNLYVHKDQAYDHFVREGVYPSPSRPLVFSDSHIWFLRINQLFWALLCCVLPTCWLWWQIIVAGLIKWAIIVVLGCIGTTIMMFGLLRFAQPAQSSLRANNQL